MNSTDRENAHRGFAGEAFNACWELIDKVGRTQAEDREMIRLAEVSFWHWQNAESRSVENEGIGLWLLARVYALAAQPDVANDYADTYLNISTEHGLGPFHEGYAWEAKSRAWFVAGNKEKCISALSNAKEFASVIDDADSREMLETDLNGLDSIAGELKI